MFLLFVTYHSFLYGVFTCGNAIGLLLLNQDISECFFIYDSTVIHSFLSFNPWQYYWFISFQSIHELMCSFYLWLSYSFLYGVFTCGNGIGLLVINQDISECVLFMTRRSFVPLLSFYPWQYYRSITAQSIHKWCVPSIHDLVIHSFMECLPLAKVSVY